MYVDLIKAVFSLVSSIANISFLLLYRLVNIADEHNFTQLSSPR